ncbi:MAG: hypothetical protein FWF80_08095 [Defluviitaleaceae bacterium]|nr:hypothetical protein [Defluviitaleaceae bacterium]
MATVQAYQGYFQADGRFVADGSMFKLPTMRRVIVNVLSDEIINPDISAYGEKLARLRKVLDAARSAEGEIADSDWNELENIRERTNGGMARAINL